jgi:hypothetical protein
MPLLTQVRFYIPERKDIPAEMVERWQMGYYQQVHKTSGQRRKAVGNVKDYQTKVAQPLQDVTARYISPTFYSRSGRSAAEILRLQAKALKKSGRKYLKKLDAAYRTVNGVRAKYIKDRLPEAGFSYAEAMAWLVWPLLAGDEPGKPGPVLLAQRWLTGEQTVLSLLRKEDEHLTGEPILITDKARVKQFKLQLYRRLVWAGRQVIKTDYLPEAIRLANETTNRLLQQFARAEFAPFRPGSDSHLDFIIKELPDPKDLTKTIKQLYLEVQVAHS